MHVCASILQERRNFVQPDLHHTSFVLTTQHKLPTPVYSDTIRYDRIRYIVYSMSTQLHARKRGEFSVAEYSDATTASNNDEKRNNKKQQSTSRQFVFTVGCVVLTIALAAALAAAYSLPSDGGNEGLLPFLSQPMAPPHPSKRHFSYVTVVMPSVVKPQGRPMRLSSIAATWGPLSHAIYVVHNVTDFPQAPLLDPTTTLQQQKQQQQQMTTTTTYPQNLLVPPEISPEDAGLPRMNYVIRTVYEQLNPDFAFFVNDHTFVIPDHLCSYLTDKSPDEHLYAGHALKHGPDDAFNSGAAGYVLSRTTMKGLVAKWDEDNERCLVPNGKKNKWLQNNPGLATAACLAQEMDVHAIDTRDEEDKSHRFHAFGLVAMVAGKVDEWYINKHKHFQGVSGFDESYAHLSTGGACCSKETVSFHYVEYTETKVLFHIRQELLARPSMTDADLKAMMMKEWPTDWAMLGGYSKPLPKEEDIEGWTPLLKVIRMISAPSQVTC